MKKFIFLTAVLISIFSCSTVDSERDTGQLILKESALKHQENVNVVGTKYSEATIALNGAYNRFINSLKKINAISIIAEVDHERNAKSVGLELNSTKIVFFGNPTLGTPLMQKNQLAGLDLPQKVLFYENDQKDVFAMYNSVDYLESRYGLGGVSSLSDISNALKNLVSKATKGEIMMADKQSVSFEEGIIKIESDKNMSDTYRDLRQAIAINSNLSIVAELDHSANAATVNMQLAPTKLIIFGNPNLGTPLMQDSQTAGLDLPQKMLVWQEGDLVYIAYNDPYYLKDRHNLKSSDTQIEIMSMALSNLAAIAKSE